MTYSTYGYIVKNIQTLAPHIPIFSIPGITSYQAAAATLNTPLTEGEESLLVVSGANGGDRLRQLSAKPETVVFLKAYRNVKDIMAALDEAGRLKDSVAVSSCGLPEEKIFSDIRKLGDLPPEYWTLILSKSKKSNAG